MIIQPKLLGFTALAVVLSSPAYAQEAASAGGNQIEEIVVTAQRREQRLQDVPLAVTAFKGSTLESAGVTAITRLDRLDSALTLTFSASTARPYVRGVGNASTGTVGNESSVAFYLDDVYYTRMSTAYLALAGIDRVEVLKGPQGTLFGRNASGGLIHIITREPRLDRQVVELTAGYGNYNTLTGKLYASAPITDKVAIDLSVTAKDQQRGYGRNIFTGNRIWKEDYISLRSKLIAEPTDRTKITLIGYYADAHTQFGFQYGRHRDAIGGTPPLYGAVQPLRQSDAGGFYNVNVNYDPRSHSVGYGGSLKIEQDIDFAKLVSISAYRNGHDSGLYAGALTTFPFLGYLLYSKDRQYSQELQVKSNPDSPVDWVGGLYYLHVRAGYLPTRVFGDQFGRGSSGPDLGNPTLQTYLDINGLQKVDSYAGFGQATFHVIPENTNITLGLRYTIDKLKGEGSQNITFNGGATFSPAASPNPYINSAKSKKLTYKVALDHKFSRDIMGYVTISRGYKSGVFNTLPLNAPATRPEIITTYEAGLKTQLLDNRVRLNASIFQNDIKDLQVQVIRVTNGIGAVFIQNAGAARTKGIEAEGEAIVANGLSLRFGINYLDAKYTSFKNAPFLTQQFAAPFGFVQTAGDATGNRITQSPKWKTNGSINYVLDTDAGKLEFNTSLSYQTKFFWGPDNNITQRGYSLVDASVAFSPTDSLKFRVWATNLFSTKYYTTVQLGAGANAATESPAAPRMFGVEASLKF